MKDEERIRRYLLGELSGTAKQRFESRYFTDTKCFEMMNAVENDLIDSYVHGLLPVAEQRSFRLQYLDSPARRERVEFARALAEKVVQSEDLTAPFPRPVSRSRRFSRFDWLRSQRSPVLASCAGVMAAAIVVLLVNDADLRRELVVQRASNDTLRADIESLKQAGPGRPGAAETQSDN